MNIVLFGNVPLATWVLTRLHDCSGAKTIGVVCDPVSRTFEHHKLGLECVFDYAKKHIIPVWSLDDLPGILAGHPDLLGISCRFPHIISPSVIALFDKGIVNLHGGELPRFRGVNIANHSILEGVARGAGTLHYIDEGVDTGPIIDREYFSLSDIDTAYDVFLKTQDALKRVFDRNAEVLVSDRVCATPQQEFLMRGEISRVYKAADLSKARQMPFDLSPDGILRHARAFHFPGHEPAHWMIGNRKVFITLE